MSTYIIQPNLATELVIINAIPIENDDLIYSLGGNFSDGTLLKFDNVVGNKNAHKGNPKLLPDETPIYKKCNKVNVINETITVVSAPITRGLYKYEGTGELKNDSTYYWDEVYTTPMGYYTCLGNTSILAYEFSLQGNILELLPNDVNIVPKIGDYIIMQKLPSGYVRPIDLNTLPVTPGGLDAAAFAGIFTDGMSNMPVIFNTETYQLKITEVTYDSISIGLSTKYTIILDKSLTVDINDEYAIILLNRENTGLQKELFYDTFEQIEVQREQLLGDPYFETSLAKPAGRKNFLNYNNGQYLGIRNLLSGVLKSNEEKFLDTPFIVYDIDEDMRDRFCTTPSTIGDYQFEFHLPTVILQDDVDDKLNVLVNYGAPLNDLNGAGKYSGLYLRWQQTLSKRLGFIFYDLRIIVIDDAELATALSYNSNRNYTLPKLKIESPGNYTPNATSSITLDIVGLQSSNVEPMIIIVNGNHNLKDGDVITISEVKTKTVGTNLIHSSNANGIRYVKRYYVDPANTATEALNKFYIYTDQSFTTSLPSDGIFVSSGIGQSGKIKGAKLKYNYFITYRIKNNRHSSILPYSELINFNFSSTAVDTNIDNNAGSAYVSLPAFTYLDNGYEINNLEFIIGEWEANNTAKPYEVTGFKNVIVIDSTEIISPSSPSNFIKTNYIISKDNYNTAVSKMSSLLGPYTLSNLDGNTSYDILNNFKHYNIINGTLSDKLNTAEGKWTLGNIKYKVEADQYRSKLQITVNSNEWNDTLNPSYDPTNEFIKSKYISEVAICDTTSEKPIIYAKIAPPIKKTGDLDLLINLSIDF